MAKITITIENIQDSELLKWLGLLKPVKNGIVISRTNESGEIKEFWEKYLQYEDEYNHSINPELIAVNIPHFVQAMKNIDVECQTSYQLKELFKSSLNSSCLGQKTVYSKFTHKATKCWIFKK